MASLLLLTCCFLAQTEEIVSKDLHERCLVELRGVLDKGEEFVKVHAAESLLWTGYPEGVREAFLSEPQTIPKYRIGVWRVLAQAAVDKQERAEYEGRILAVLLDPSAPDRLHAAETLGKLGINCSDVEILRLSKEEAGPFQTMARWILANSGRAEDEAFLAGLLESPDPAARGCAAYAFRFFKTVRPETYQAIKRAAENESPDSPWLAHLLSSCYLHASADAKPALRLRLLQCVESGNKEQKREACAALGRNPHPEDIVPLRALLADSDMDVRAGAAEAILFIERRLKP